MNSGVSAEIGDGITVEASYNGEAEYDGSNKLIENGSVTVESSAKNTADVQANASATGSDIGVGVGVAINVVTFENIAVVGLAAVTADHLTVRASIIEDSAEETSETSDTPENWIAKLLRQLIEEMAEAMGLSDLIGDSETLNNLIDDLVTAMSDFAEDLLAGTGLEELVNGVDPITQVKENVSAFLDYVMSMPTLIKDKINEQIAKLGLTEVVSGDKSFAEVVKDATLSALENIGNSIKSALMDNASTALTNVFQNNITALLTGSLTSASLLQSLKTEFMGLISGENGVLTTIQTKVTDEIKAKFKTYFGMELGTTSDEMLANIQTKISEQITSFANQAMETLTEGLVDVDAFSSFLKTNVKDTLFQNLKTALKNLGVAVTNAALDAATAWLGVQIETEALPAAHEFTTVAVAGAGAKNVGVPAAWPLRLLTAPRKPLSPTRRRATPARSSFQAIP